MATYSPEIKSLYLKKRKRVSLLANEEFGPSYPKFNTPEMKSKLQRFCDSLEENCAVPQVGFTKDGIMKHVKDYCCEQRRYRKSKNNKQPVISQGESSDEAIYQNKSVMQTEMDDDNDSTTSSTDTVPVTEEESDDGQAPISSQAIPTGSANASEFIKGSPNSIQVDASEKLSSHTTQVILKLVFGSTPNRENVCKLLTSRFGVSKKNLTLLKPTQLWEIMAQKLLSNKYVSVKEGASLESSEEVRYNCAYKNYNALSSRRRSIHCYYVKVKNNLLWRSAYTFQIDIKE
ncbi:uncharacterized protein LOC110237427 isoform X1 [Exaiptasia diaphana]|uniref:Uncharacterized protein n=1 Tax=Exaiptasia diaphana TaxID=2652724 RepID=A0A913X438_EXADI|nr:uncharacterized protein LOC110237427 isoform X1 [Exaiptasia diaphana]